MTAPNLPACLDFTLHWEGGFQNNPNDAGNYLYGTIGGGPLIGTNMGITPRTLMSWLDRPLLASDMRDLTRETAAAIYRTRFWNTVYGDSLSAGVDLMGFDHAVMAGPDYSLAEIGTAQAASVDAQTKWLDAERMKLVQLRLTVPADGIFGPVTRAALSQRPVAQNALHILYLGQLQEQYYRRLSGFTTFGIGWLNRLRARQTAALNLMDEAHVSA
ncbi:hypothetical protein AAJCM20276_26790 [Acetobacter aceti]|uniref:TtsA-like Glycoside hydrolase family 108 domain-containing protein n=1 Tax=Acetobacter aceti TaxID=435 RepID=A0A6S6PN14_ACEAC|nr:glycosyl hydrolase 108 family protein [Acetobacter aceti]BCI68055.1 hypothetical protein AAJCM20276_26790 [Acetobacter aceti]